MSRGAKQKQRAQAFKDQKAKTASDFNFNQHGEGHISQQEAKYSRKNYGLRDSYAAMQEQKEGGAAFSNRAENQFNRMGARIDKLDARKAAKQKAKAAQGSTGQAKNPIDQTVTGENDSVPANEDTMHAAVMPDDYGNGMDNFIGGSPGFYDQQNTTEIENTQTQDVTQDNDISTNVDGNNNTVVNNQDNSVRQYGGDNRSFVYNSNGGGAGSDMPASMATLSGFFAPDDSPAAQAKFNDMYSTMNADNQKRYAGAAMETFAKYRNVDARDYTPEAMETALGRSTQYSFDRADRQTAQVFGDIWNDKYITEKWKMPTPPKAIESNAEEIANKAKEDIEDV